MYASQFLSRHNNDLEWWTLKPLASHSSWVLNKPCHSSRQISVTALFYLEDSKRIHPRRTGVEECASTHVGTGEAVGVGGGGESTWLLLLHVFFPLGLPYANWAQPGVLFYLNSSLWSLGLSLTFLCSILGAFPFLVFSPLPFWTPFPILTT